ncbi:outer membrane beta-barrel protein [Geobacter sp. AOG2]|uniref:outer membrane beta-barrel protein n=1 Tax=Geobacter sp. AOG2 TaxID=1566347 RepID=UPI001CC6676D|nr:outer membrane beta-barrel protein [Geobacter sp. AOG2]
MKTNNILFLALAVLLICIASPAAAEDKPANYVAFKGGIYSPSLSHDVNNFNGGSTTHLDSKTGFAGEVALGHYFLPMLALELGAGYFQSKGSPAAEPGDTMLKVVPLVATGKVLLPLGIFEPYGLFGIGAYVTDLDVSGNTGNFHGSTKITYGLHAGGGFNINFSNSMFVGVEGKYLWAEPSFGGQHIRLDGFTTTADLGFRF